MYSLSRGNIFYSRPWYLSFIWFEAWNSLVIYIGKRVLSILRGFQTSDVNILVWVFNTYVRPLLKFNTLVWNPWLFKDIECIERVQKINLQMCQASSHGSCILVSKSWITIIKISSCLFWPCNVLSNCEKACGCWCFWAVYSQCYHTFHRGNSCKLQTISISHQDFQLYCLTCCIIPIWNTLSEHVVSTQNHVTLKSHLKTVDLSHFDKLYPCK